MSGKIKIGGLVFAAALVVLGAWFAYGQATQDPCGGTYAGEGLKAFFWPTYMDLNPQNPDPQSPIEFPGRILNDFGPLVPYQYQVPGGDCVFLYRRGHVVVAIDRPQKADGSDEDRFVQIDLVLVPGSNYCDNTPATLRMAHIHTVSFGFGTEKEFIGTRENGKLILNCKKYGWNYLNFATMTPGQTTYAQIGFNFKVFGDPIYYRLDTQAKVYYGPLSIGGGSGWEITPIHEPYVVRVTETRGKRIVDVQNTPHYPSVYMDMGGCPEGVWKPGSEWTPWDGLYHFPFKLILQRLN